MNIDFLSKTALFQGTSPQEIQSMLKCLNPQKRSFRKGEIIFHAGDTTTTAGLVLSGTLSIENDDFLGNRSVLDMIQPGQIFAETYACIPNEPLMVNVIATVPASVLFLDTNHILHTCPDNCAYHNKLIQNLLSISARKNLTLSRRIFHTAPKSIRGRLISYLSFQSARQGTNDFTIPFNRQQLADYLNVDRSALSNELSKMQKEGLLEVKKNHFHIIP